MFLKIKKGSIFKTICLLGAISLPGVQRILLYFTIESFFGLSALGRFANDLSIVFMIGFFSAVGWSSMIMIRVPQSEGLGRYQTLFSIARLSVLSLIPAFVVLFALGFLKLVFDPFLSSMMLGAWSFFMLFRRFLLAVKKYTILLCSELLLATSIPLILWSLKQYPAKAPYICYAVPCAAISFVGAFFVIFTLLKNGKGFFNSQPGAARHGFEFGLNNFVSGGRTLLLTPFAVHLAGDVYGGVLGFINSVLGVVLLFPRTFSQYHLPDLSRLVIAQNKDAFYQRLGLFRKQVVMALIGVCFLASVGWIILGFTPYGSKIQVAGAGVIFFIMLFAIAVDQAVLAEVNSFMVRELSTLLLRVNIGSAILLLLLILIPVAFPFSPLYAMYFLLSAFLLSNIFRSAWIVKHAHAYNQH